MRKYEKLNKKRWNDFIKNTVKCKCGHSITFGGRSTKVICWWCGNYCYKNKKEEFKEKLAEKTRRLNG